MALLRWQTAVLAAALAAVVIGGAVLFLRPGGGDVDVDACYS